MAKKEEAVPLKNGPGSEKVCKMQRGAKRI